MKTAPLTLAADLASPAVDSFLVAIIDLDTGPLCLTDGRHVRLGGQELLPAVRAFGNLERGQADISVLAAGLPDRTRGAVWMGRRCRVFRVTADAALVERGLLLVDGVIERQALATSSTDEPGGEWSLTVGRPLYLQEKTVPGFGVIEAGAYPRASDKAMGRDKPMVFGTVERCPLLLVDGGWLTTLSADAHPGDAELVVADASSFPETGSVRVGNVTYIYGGRDDTRFFGLIASGHGPEDGVTARHVAGSVVHEPKSWTWLAAGHPVTGIAAVTAGDTALTGYTTDLTAATVTFPTPPVREQVGALATLYAQFDRVNAGSTAIDGANAILAATGAPQVQNATNLPLVVSAPSPQPSPAGGEGALSFARPTAAGGTDTIIGAAYEAAFTVASSVDCEVKIGGRIVHVRRGGAVIYNGSPVAWIANDNADQMPVAITVPEGTPAGAVTVTLTAAERTVVVGNNDRAAFAQLKATANKVLSVRQTTAMPDRGRIRRALLGIEWFANDLLLDSEHIEVRFAGVTLGTLRRVADGAQSVTQSFSFDLAASGRARMQSNDIQTTVSGGTTTLANKPTVVRQTVSAAYAETVAGNGYWKTLVRIVPPPNVKSGTHTIRITAHNAGSGTVAIGVHDDVSGGFGSPSRTPTISSGGLATSGFYITTAGSTTPVGVSHDAGFESQNSPRIASVEIEWQINAIAETNTPASGSSTPSSTVLTNGLALTGVVSDSDSLTLPAGDRTVANVFDLPLGTRWDWFTEQDLEIELVSSRTELVVAIVWAQVMIEHEPVALVPAEPDSLTATVSGLDGNPAEIARVLADAAGDRLAPEAFRRARGWFERSGWSFARVIDKDTPARRLLFEVCAEACLDLCETDAGLALVRQLDMGTPVTDIGSRDLLEPVRVSWSPLTERFNDLTLRYRAIDGDTTRVLTRNADTPDRWAIRGERDCRARLPVTRDSAWIADDITAAAVLAARLRLEAPLRRTFALALRPAFVTLEAGDLVRVNGVVCRAGLPRADGIRVTVEAVEIPV